MKPPEERPRATQPSVCDVLFVEIRPKSLPEGNIEMVQDKDVFVEQSSIRHLEYDVGGIADDKEERRRRWRKKMLVILKEERVARVERGDVKRLLKIQKLERTFQHF